MRALNLLIASKADAATLVQEPPVRTLRDYLAAEIETPPILVTPTIVVRGELTVTIGRAGKGKTSVNLHRLIRYSAGLPMFDEIPDVLAPVDNTPLKILLIENEGSAGMFQEKVRTMVTSESFLPADARELVLDNFMIWGDGGWSGVKLDDDDNFDLLKRGIEKHQPDIVFLEPFRGLWRGNENDSTEMAEVLDRFALLATEYEIGLVVAHHEKKGYIPGEDKMSAGRGSTAFEGYAAVMENFERAKGDEQRELSWSKSRYEPAPGPIRMEWDNDSKSYRYIAPEKGAKEILDLLQREGDAMTIKDIAEELEETDQKVRKLIKGLEDDGRVKKTKAQYVGGAGMQGARYRLVSTDDEENGGLPI